MDFLSHPLFPELFQRVSVTHSLSGFSRLLNPVGTDHSSITIHRAHPPVFVPSLTRVVRIELQLPVYYIVKGGMASTILNSFQSFSLWGREGKNGSFEQGYSMINSSLNPCSTESFCIFPSSQTTLGRGHTSTIFPPIFGANPNFLRPK